MALSGTPWQLECEKVEQRCGYLLTSGLWSDCMFMIGSETNQEVIQAHKLVLAMASPVFEAMFYGGLSEQRNDPIVPIPDIKPEAFRALLHYIYTGSINIDSFDMARDLWYGAEKYMLPHLITECNTYISSVLTSKNACKAYELAHLFDDKNLTDKCIEIISTKTKEVLNDSSLEDIELHTLITVCSLDDLNVDSELELFNAVARYAEAEQRRQGEISPPVEGRPAPEELSDKVLQSTESCSQTSPAAEEVVTSKPTADKDDLKEEQLTIRAALQKIRFLSLSAQEFGEGPARSGLLTQDESFKVFMNITSTDSAVPMPSGFSESRHSRRQPPSDSKQHCYKAGSLEHTIHALKFGNPSQVKEAALVASSILHRPRDIQPALDKGILDALVPILTKRYFGCKEHAAIAIYNLCSNGSRSQISALAASAALEPFCRLLAAGGDTCYWVLYGLNQLLKAIIVYDSRPGTYSVDIDTKLDLISKLRAIGVPQLLMLTAQQDDYQFDSGIKTNGELANDLLQTYFSDVQ